MRYVWVKGITENRNKTCLVEGSYFSIAVRILMAANVMSLCWILFLKSCWITKQPSNTSSMASSSSSSSSSCHTISTDLPDPLLPPFSIVHCFQQVFRATSHISIELLYVGSSWLSCLCSSMWGGSVRVHHLWVHPYFSSSVLHIWFI